MAKTPLGIALPIVTQPKKPEFRKTLDAGFIIPDLIRGRHDRLININFVIYKQRRSHL